MLSRTADNLYWLARYVERAEYLARILEATQRLAALPLAYVGATQRMGIGASRPPAAPTRSSPRYDEANEENVTDFLAFSPDNPSSIRNCFEVARANARAVRTALTVEMWEAINGAWLELQALRQRADVARGVRALPALGAGSLAALRRLGLPHHAAQRRLLVLAARRLSSSAPTTPRASST